MVLELPALEGLNEADVREEIVAPLLRELGYRSGTRANVIREQTLLYPRAYIGRKKPGRDPLLRGRADYICDAGGVRWTLEAKPPSAPISIDDIEQAYTYANHPEVRAALFAIFNGHELRIYQTNRGPDVEPVLIVPYDELSRSLDGLRNMLEPAALERDHPSVRADLGEPIGLGLRSIVRISGGLAEFRRASPTLPLFADITLFVTGGEIERQDGHLVLYAETRSPFRSVSEFSQRLGLSRLEMVSQDRLLSSSINAPTVFEQSLSITLAAGEVFPSLAGEGDLILPENVHVDAATKAVGTLKGSLFSGVFNVAYRYLGLPGVTGELAVSAEGTFSVSLM